MHQSKLDLGDLRLVIWYAQGGAVPALVPQLFVICDVTSQASPVQERQKGNSKDSHTSDQGGR